MSQMNVSGYESLHSVLLRAYDQAARTKGAERHANDKPFDEQPMQTIAAKHGVGFLLGQADKKAEEAHGMWNRGEAQKAAHELLGAINYLAGAVIYMDMNAGKPADNTLIKATTEKVADAPTAVPNDEAVQQGAQPAGEGKEKLTTMAKAFARALDEEQDEECQCIVCQMRRSDPSAIHVISAPREVSIADIAPLVLGSLLRDHHLD